MEHLDSGALIKLCDVIEVIYALLKVHGVLQSKFEDMRKKKGLVNGTFEKRIFLKQVR
jgi:predicted house-cleaning noncanonical NTP pyrophosphatase (MazG superfamily)